MSVYDPAPWDLAAVRKGLAALERDEDHGDGLPLLGEIGTMTSTWDWAHESAARRSDAYGAGLRDGEAAFKAGRPASSCDPADWDERYAANYRNGWEHAYHGAARDAAAGPLDGRYQITYATGLPAIGAATLTRTVTAYNYAAARGAAEEYVREIGNESGAVLAVTGITRL